MVVYTSLLLCLAALVAGSDLALEQPVSCGQTDPELFYYDDGYAYWLTWSGQWRGTWFTMDDFGAAGNSLECDYSQFWFYHHSSYCWDSGSFCAELWTDESGLPSTMISQETALATHYSANCTYYDPPLDCGNAFWVLANTAFSSGGWPSTLGDNTPQPSVSHSFFSDDSEVWEPWIIQGPFANDLLVRAHGAFVGLQPSTWAGIKGLFR